MDQHPHVQHPILKRVYALDGDVQERTGIYDEWAGDYDKDTIEGMGYTGPALAADRLAELVPADTPVLDAGCGTGLVGSELAQRGFSVVDGTDLSQGMLDVARTKGVYGRLECADITLPLPFAPESYGAVICVGTFTAGHVGPEGMDPLIAVARPGAYVVMTVMSEVWERMGFSRHVEDLGRRGAAHVIDNRADQTYHTKEDVTCRVVVLRTGPTPRP